MKWQPIETAPKDGTKIRIKDNVEETFKGKWVNSYPKGWDILTKGYNPHSRIAMYWMPIPQ